MCAVYGSVWGLVRGVCCVGVLRGMLCGGGAQFRGAACLGTLSVWFFMNVKV